MILSARRLTKRYGDPGDGDPGDGDPGNGDPGWAAVREASLELAGGEFVSIVGRSGSGKSTLLAMLGALTRPTQGELLLDGSDIWTLPETRLADFRCRHIGFVFQFASLLSNLTALDNVAVPALLGRTMAPSDAYARARSLLARVGLADRAEAYPGSLSGGEQRRAVIARALINAPPLLLADEPTSDLDEDTESDIIDLLDTLHRAESFGIVLVTHNLDLARRAQRTYEMRQGVLTAVDLARPAVEPQFRPRRFGAAAVRVRPEPPESPESSRPPGPSAPPPVPEPIRLGAGLWRGAQTLVLAAAAVFGFVLLADFGVGKYQAMQVRRHSAHAAALAELALDNLRGEIRSVADRGDGRYDLSVDLRNVGGGQPIYVMTPDMRAYVQVGNAWQEVPIEPAEAAAGAVRKIDGAHTYRYRFEARVAGYAQLLPNYMHVRFADTMLVSPSGTPKGDVFERRDNYYVYLKPFDVADEAILQRMHFPGKPPVWIPMPPH